MDIDLQKKETDDAQREVILFGQRQLLHSLLNWGIVLAIGSAWKINLLQILVFYVSYSLLRIFAGGFHAKTRQGCYLASIIFINVCFAAIQFLEWGSRLFIGLGLLSICTVLCLSPVENPKKPLNSAERTLFRRRTGIVLFGESVFLLLGGYFHLTGFMKGITVGICFVGVMVIAGNIQLFFKKKEKINGTKV